MIFELNAFSLINDTVLQLITDVNIAVATEAIQAIGNLAKGLRNHFAGNSRLVLPVLLVSFLLIVNAYPEV